MDPPRPLVSEAPAAMKNSEQPISMERALELFPKTWNYKLVKIIGKGKATTVYSGKQTRCGDRKVAVKFFDMPEDVPDEIVQREAAALRTLKHENIIRFFELARANGTKHLLIAMELVEDGLSLETVVRQFRKKPLKARVLAKWVTELAGAVQHMHEKGVIHRDISPKNILVSGKAQRSEEEEVWMSLSLKLGNFGSSKILLAGRNFSNTLVSADHSYMAPEIVDAYKKNKGAVRHDRTVDYWSLGAVIIFLGNRKHLIQRVEDPSDKKKMSIRISQDLAAAKKRAKHPPREIPEDFWELAIKAIDEEPRKRPPPSEYLESAFIKKYRATVEAGLPTGAGPSVPATPRVRALAPSDLRTGASQRPCGSMTATPATIKGKDAANPPTKKGTVAATPAGKKEKAIATTAAKGTAAVATTATEGNAAAATTAIKSKDAAHPSTKRETVAATPAGKKGKAIATTATTGNPVATTAAKGAAAVTEGNAAAATTAIKSKDAANPPTKQETVAATPASKKGKAAATPAPKEENAGGYNLRSRNAVTSKTTATKKP